MLAPQEAFIGDVARVALCVKRGGRLDVRGEECLGCPRRREENTVLSCFEQAERCAQPRVHAVTFPSEILKCLKFYSTELTRSSVPHLT